MLIALFSYSSLILTRLVLTNQVEKFFRIQFNKYNSYIGVGFIANCIPYWFCFLDDRLGKI